MKLQAQRLELERQKELAVEDAMNKLQAKLRKEFALSKELEIAAVLATARVSGFSHFLSIKNVRQTLSLSSDMPWEVQKGKHFYM